MSRNPEIMANNAAAAQNPKAASAVISRRANMPGLSVKRDSAASV